MHCYPRMLTAVARKESVIEGGVMIAFDFQCVHWLAMTTPSRFAFRLLMSLLCYITNHLMTAPSAKSQFCKITVSLETSH